MSASPRAAPAAETGPAGRKPRSRRGLRIAVAIPALVFALLVGGLLVWEKTALRLDDLRGNDWKRTIGIPLASGETRTLIVGPGSEQWTPIEAVAPDLVRAVLVAEDARFHEHAGIDWLEVSAALRTNLEAGRAVRGASTISMQVARTLFLWRSKTATRKLLEAWVAIRLESALPKRRILELYLNVVPWGPSSHGIAAAAQHYFGKTPAELDLEESALLAAILPRPVGWSPDVAPDEARRRQRLLLRRLR